MWSKTRARRWGKNAAIVTAAGALVQVAALAPALANAPNPNPDISAKATVNGNGSVTVDLSGTWSWPGQDCAGRYGEGWAVDWWGISASQTPANSFSLTDASVVTGAASTTTGTLSPAGAIQLPQNGGYFHVGEYYDGQDINSSSTCTDTGTGSSAGSTGSWSATATYPSKSDLPPQICVNMYDEHGSEGKPSGSANDFSPAKDNDNSIQTNNFDPTAGAGYCSAITITTPPPPGITTSQSLTPNDEGFLDNGQEATGKMTFSLYPPSEPRCKGTPAFTQTVTVTSGVAETTNTKFIATKPGKWRWLVTYSGSHGNASSPCGSESFTIKNT